MPDADFLLCTILTSLNRSDFDLAREVVCLTKSVSSESQLAPKHQNWHRYLDSVTEALTPWAVELAGNRLPLSPRRQRLKD